ncbi:MAG: hypothetical protein RDV00_09730 [Clostridia bacterium]|nr:hypothetical protein [Clostridia bacterium]MDQ7792382.1 hypothetical protein [Clostridia bacterium]
MLIRGVALLEVMLEGASDDQYRQLQQAMDEKCPDVSNSNRWLRLNGRIRAKGENPYDYHLHRGKNP